MAGATSPDDQLLQRYAKYLLDERGLLDRTINVYLGLIRKFLAGAAFKPDSRNPGCWDAQIVRKFLLGAARERSNKSVQSIATALRSFFRFLYRHNETVANLALAVPMVRKWRQASVPTHLTSEQIEKTLISADRSTSRGRRDYAILTLLARLGLRAGEVARLELGDIHWRTGEILLHGKGRRVDCLPLLSDIGEALADYLQKDRGDSTSRKVFLRIRAPHEGLGGPAGISQIVCRAFAHAGIRPGGRVGAHLFRHSLATRMIRHGASISEISEVLRHQFPSTTQIYAKVDIEALRKVALPWPGCGGGQ
jgi:site-specific recombinase XerD